MSCPSFIEYTLNLIDQSKEPILIVGNEFNLSNFQFDDKEYMTVTDNHIDLIEWIDAFRNSEDFHFFSTIIMSRVFEHFSFRSFDYYIYCISSLLYTQGELILTVPDMKKVFQDYLKELRKKHINYQKILRYNIEIFSEGDNIFDRHNIFTCEESMRYFLKMENIFKIKEINRVKIDTDWIDFLEFRLIKEKYLFRKGIERK